MAKLLLAVVAVGGLAAAGALAPVHGRTVLERWRSSRDTSDFLSRGWAEARGALGLGPEKPAARAQAGRGGKAPARPPRPARPQEQHSDQDRAALERIIAEHAGR